MSLVFVVTIEPPAWPIRPSWRRLACRTASDTAYSRNRPSPTGDGNQSNCSRANGVATAPSSLSLRAPTRRTTERDRRADLPRRKRNRMRVIDADCSHLAGCYIGVGDHGFAVNTGEFVGHGFTVSWLSQPELATSLSVVSATR